MNAQAALLQEGLYRQRVDGQGYSSRADRTADQLRSGIDIKDRLWARSQAEAAARYALHRDAFRRSASQAWFDLAWHLYGRQQRGPALRALLQSARRHFRARQLLLLLRLLLPRVSRSTAT